MKVLLINPPVGSAYVPPLGIICLKSFLEKNGIEVMQRDISIDFFHFLLNPIKLEKIYEKNKKLLDNKFFQKNLPLIKSMRIPREKETIHSLSQINFSETLDFLFKNWKETGFNLLETEKFGKQISLLNDGLILSTLEYFPNIVSIGICSWNKNLLYFKKINPFYNFYKEKVIPEIKELKPDIIGLSLSYSFQQFLPGLSLLQKIRKSGINTPIISGGASFTSCCGYITELNGENVRLKNKKNDVPDMVRSLKYFLKNNSFGINGEGEKPLLELCRRIEQKQSFKDIPGLVYLENKKIIRFNVIGERVDFKNYPILNLDSLPIGKKYFTPLPLVTMQSSRGCYWQKCAFCDHMETLGSKFREMSVNILFEAVKCCYEKYGVKFFFFTDECMSPSMLKSLSNKIISSGIKIKFGIIARIENLLKDILPIASSAGLKFLSFGMESASDRILSRMNKGIKADDADEIINICHENNIGVHFNVIFGFPTETEKEAEMTFNFINDKASKITCFGANAWWLTPGSLVMKNPDKFGIQLKDSPINPFIPQSYNLDFGISNIKAQEYVSRLMYNKKFRKIMILNSRREEFHMLKALLSNNADKKILVEEKLI